MSYIVTCPICGPRDLYEFRFGGEVRGPRPIEEGLTPEEFCEWSQLWNNRPVAQEEWWYHRDGCGLWFTIWRDPMTNRQVDGPGDSP